MKALTNASSSRGSYVPQKLKTFLKTKISHSVFGTRRVSDALKKPDIEQKKLAEIFKKAKEEGVLRQTSSTKSESEFYKSAVKEEKTQKQVEQKNQKTINIGSKEANIKQAQQMTARAERWREAALGKGAIRGTERVYASGEQYRKQQAATSGVLKSRGGAPVEQKSTGLLNKAMQEEKGEENSPKDSKGGQKGGKSASAGQKSGGHEVVKLQGSAGIDQLTHPQEISKNENFTGGVYHVKGLDQPPASQPETPPASKPASAPEDITDLDIG